LNYEVDNKLVVDSTAQGDLTHEIDIKGEGVIGKMGEGLIKSLVDMRGNIAEQELNLKASCKQSS
jgi:hypothetical protein